VLLVLNNATYESISITAWMGANPDLPLATNFGVPKSVFAKFPKTAVIMPDSGPLGCPRVRHFGLCAAFPFHKPDLPPIVLG
jgi:hypothetical protein